MIVVDTSAMVAVMLRVPDAVALADLIRRAVRPRISAASVLETHVFLRGRTGRDTRDQLERFFRGAEVDIEPVTSAQLWLAADAYRRFGKGYHRACLNYGDCFSYALARDLGFPLLYKGGDFALTDIPAAAG